MFLEKSLVQTYGSEGTIVVLSTYLVHCIRRAENGYYDMYHNLPLTYSTDLRFTLGHPVLVHQCNLPCARTWRTFTYDVIIIIIIVCCPFS